MAPSLSSYKIKYDMDVSKVNFRANLYAIIAVHAAESTLPNPDVLHNIFVYMI